MIDKVYKDKKVLITGNTGFKGTWLTTWLLKMGAKVYGMSKDVPTSPSMFQVLELENKIHYYNVDIRNYDEVYKVLEEVKPDFLFHLAAQAIVSTSYKNPTDTITTNVVGTMNILEALRQINNFCTAIIITSDKCYDNVEWIWGYKETDRLGGKDIYSGSKGSAELIFKSYYYSFFHLQQSNIRVASVRAGNVIGGGDWALDRIVPDCMRAWSEDKIVEIRSPKATRPWQHVLEPLSGYLNLAASLFINGDLNGESFNFGPSTEYNKTVLDLLGNLSKCWNFNKSSDAYLITDDIKFHEAGLLKLNCDKALFYLSWQPALNYDELIDFTGDWYYRFYKDNCNMFDYTIKQIEKYEILAKNKKIKWAL
ncbi:MAG: CDP-glucose 4,6-dehydratase [Parabacteroides sp.]